MRKFLLGLIVLIANLHSVKSQLLLDLNLPKYLTHGSWTAKPIYAPDISRTEYQVNLFRKSFEVSQKPDSFIIHVSADNRYKLWINGQKLGLGPARSDEKHWIYETYNIARYLKQGTNTIAIQQWFMADDAPIAQHQIKSEIIVQGNSSKEWQVNTGPKGWKVYTVKSHFSRQIPQPVKRYYFVAGSGDSLLLGGIPINWQESNFDDSNWPMAVRDPRWTASTLVNTGIRDYTPRTIPAMVFQPLGFNKIIKGETNGLTLSKGEFSGKFIPKTKSLIILDLGVLTTGYPQLRIKKGLNAKIKFTYAEALFNTESGPNKFDKATGKVKLWKGNRNDFKSKSLEGNEDVLIASGASQNWEPLWQRTFRFLGIEVETADEPLEIIGLNVLECTYPFADKGYFRAKGSEHNLDSIQKVAFRTALLCAGETYFDCPYYEQLQYVGDTRIQALISLYRTGDNRLVKKAIQDFANSIIPEGITQSRYPSYDRQLIPTFSLVWIGMLYDYYMLRPDKDFIKPYLGGVYSILNWWESYLREDGLLGQVPYWNFTDWTPKYERGDPDNKKKGGSITLTLQYLMAIQNAAELMQAFARPDEANKYLLLAKKISTTIREKGWDKETNRYKEFDFGGLKSQHTQILAVLTDVHPKAEQADFIKSIAVDDSLLKATIYFRFYLFKAFEKTGTGNQYLSSLKTWNDMLSWGLTTFPESEPELEPRSDCHAWSASPLYDLLRITAGIKPASPGFSKILIEPAIGNLSGLEAKAMHWAGPIELSMSRKKIKGWEVQIKLPEKEIPATFKWQGKDFALKPGKNQLDLPE